MAGTREKQRDHAGCDQVLHEVVKNDRQHDLWVIGERDRGQDEPRAIVVHAQPEHERNHGVAVRLQQRRHQIA